MRFAKGCYLVPFLMVASLSGQINVRGLVRDSVTKALIAGAVASSPDAKVADRTGDDGRFTLALRTSIKVGDEIVFRVERSSYRVYQKKAIASNAELLDVLLTPTPARNTIAGRQPRRTGVTPTTNAQRRPRVVIQYEDPADKIVADAIAQEIAATTFATPEVLFVAETGHGQVRIQDTYWRSPSSLIKNIAEARLGVRGRSQLFPIIMQDSAAPTTRDTITLTIPRVGKLPPEPLISEHERRAHANMHVVIIPRGRGKDQSVEAATKLLKSAGFRVELSNGYKVTLPNGETHAWYPYMYNGLPNIIYFKKEDRLVAERVQELLKHWIELEQVWHLEPFRVPGAGSAYLEEFLKTSTINLQIALGR